jgi:large subunit ribosomal protein L1
VAVGPSEEELARLPQPGTGGQAKLEPSVTAQAASDAGNAKQSQGIATLRQAQGKLPRNDKVVKTKVSKVPKGQIRSNKYYAVAKMVDKTKTYSLKDALTLLPKIHLAKFDETIELHINTTQNGIRVNTNLPHGTGKKLKVAIANDKIIESVAKGKIDFDVLLAEPLMMPKLARIAKFLGPRGLMPNPKNGTISNNPKELAKKYEQGRLTIKTESKTPIMHVAVGKLSFGEKKLRENIQAVFIAVKPENIKNVTLKSTMSPGIKFKLGY